MALITRRIRFFCPVFAVTVLIFLHSCLPYYFRSSYNDTNTLLHETRSLSEKPFLKAHLKNGDVFILRDTWQIDTNQDTLSGNGIAYDFNRKKLYEGKISIPISNVAVFETNKKITVDKSSRVAALSILAGADVILGIICLTNPKACFGCCPSFYLNENDNIHYADAEGFSNAISPSLEYYDIDALNNNHLSGNLFSITMKNEALETHCVKDVKLLAAVRKGNERIYQSPIDEFYQCENIYPLSFANGPEGEISNLISSDDKLARISLADEKNLCSKEEICCEFDNITYTGNLGLVISFRQSLMTTYLIYSAIGYSGNQVGDIFAKLETDDQINFGLKNGIRKELGNIDLYLWNDRNNSWEFQGGFYETGPIAFNHQILPLTGRMPSNKIKIKLVLNKGLWHIDYIALSNIINKVNPVEIGPVEILSKGNVDNMAMININQPDKYLISMPGDAYKFNFILPQENQDYELFLYTKGYYLEWMRGNWIQDKNLSRLRLMIEKPAKYLKAEAKRYKKYETTMDKVFWNSKINTKTFSHHEN